MLRIASTLKSPFKLIEVLWIAAIFKVGFCQLAGARRNKVFVLWSRCIETRGHCSCSVMEYNPLPCDPMGCYNLKFGDVELEILNASVESIESSIKNKTAGIIAVNLLGNPSELHR